MRRSARLVVLWTAAVAASVVAGVLVTKWPALIAEYHVFQFERAREYEDARSWLAAIEDDAARGVTDAIFARLRAGTSYAAYWLFTVAGDAELKGPLAGALEERLRANEETMRLWSHFVRWREGARLLYRLDSMSPSPEASEAQLLCRIRIPSTPPGFTPDGKPTHPNAMKDLISDRDAQADLYDLAILWFLGAPLPPPGERPMMVVLTWLHASAPLLRSTDYDDRLGRCRRQEESDSLPSRVQFAKRGLPVPQVPLPGWEGEVP